MRYTRTTRDRSHLSIVAGLKSYGFSVADLSMVGNSIPDLIVSSSKCTVLVEIKEVGAKFYVSQLEFLSTWKGYAGFATSLEEARALVSDPAKNCLSDADKDKIGQIAHRYKAKTKARNPEILVSVFDRLMKDGN